MTLFHRLSKTNSNKFFVSADCHPQTVNVLKLELCRLVLSVITKNPESELGSDEPFGLLLQYPATNGAISDYSQLVEKYHSRGISVAVAADLLSLMLLHPPGNGVQILSLAVHNDSECQWAVGGHMLLFFATSDALKRSLRGASLEFR